MLRHSFSHISSIGAGTEQKIWEHNIHSIDDFLKSPPSFLSANKIKTITKNIETSIEKLENRDPHFFYDNLPAKEQWRIFKDFRDSTAYIDIETTGLGDPGDIITTIALYDGKTIKHYVNGKNLNDFVDDIQKYKVIVTYNGKTFDVPFITRFFGVEMNHAHLDLRYILQSLGFSGGLKSCEKQMGIGRKGDLADIDGFFAVLLWYEYKNTNDKSTLETLLSYNIEDVFSLESLMVNAYNLKINSTGIQAEHITVSKQPDNPFQVDHNIVEKLSVNNESSYVIDSNFDDFYQILSNADVSSDAPNHNKSKVSKKSNYFSIILVIIAALFILIIIL